MQTNLRQRSLGPRSRTGATEKTDKRVTGFRVIAPRDFGEMRCFARETELLGLLRKIGLAPAILYAALEVVLRKASTESYNLFFI